MADRNVFLSRFLLKIEENKGTIHRFVATLLPTLIALGVQLVTFAITARGLGPGSFGQYSIILAFAAVTVELVGMGGADIMVRATSRDPAQFARYFGHMMILILTTFPFVVWVCFIVVTFYDNPGLTSGLILLGLAGEILVSRAAASCELALVAHHRADWAGWLRIVTAGMRLVAALGYFIVIERKDLEGWIVAVSLQAIITSALLFGVVIHLYGWPKMVLQKGELKSGIAFSANQTARSMQGNLDRVILAHFADTVLLGIYSAASRMMQVGLFPLQTLTRLTYPQFFIEGAKGLSASKAYAVRVMPAYLLLGVGAAIAVVAASWALPFIIGHDFSGTSGYGVLLACALPFMALQYPAADALTGAGHQSLRAIIYWISTLSLGFVMVLGAKLFAAPGLIGGYILGQAAMAAALWVFIFIKKS